MKIYFVSLTIWHANPKSCRTKDRGGRGSKAMRYSTTSWWPNQQAVTRAVAKGSNMECCAWCGFVKSTKGSVPWLFAIQSLTADSRPWRRACKNSRSNNAGGGSNTIWPVGKKAVAYSARSCRRRGLPKQPPIFIVLLFRYPQPPQFSAFTSSYLINKTKQHATLFEVKLCQPYHITFDTRWNQ